MNSYACKHPRLDIVAIVSAPNALEAMRSLMKRDQSWGDLGLNECVWVGKHKGATDSFTLFGSEDCGTVASIKDVIAEVDRRRRETLPCRLKGMLKRACGRP